MLGPRPLLQRPLNEALAFRGRFLERRLPFHHRQSVGRGAEARAHKMTVSNNQMRARALKENSSTYSDFIKIDTTCF